MSLRQKTISGLSWSLADNVSNYSIQFIVGIILARLLTPKEYGLIGMITIFIAVSQSLIDSGFSQALIRKNPCKQEDFCTVFFFNFLIGVFFYLGLFFSADLISRFFNEPKLFLLIRVLGINLLINSLGLIQRTILIKNINFKLQTKISVISSILSGVTSILMAYRGWGVWSLVCKTTVQNTCTVFLLWAWNRWRPSLLWSLRSFRELFGFGSKLLISGLIDTVYRNIYYMVIGKYFSAAELGYYTRAEQFKNIPSQNVIYIIQRVSYPVLSSIQGDDQKLKSGYRKLIKNSMLISFLSLMGMAAISKSLILALIGAKWVPSVPYLQLLCLAAMLYPLHALNLNILNVKGRSDLYLTLEIIKKVIAVPTILLGVFCGIKIMIVGMVFNSVVSCYLNGHWSGKLIGYPMKEQVLDVAPSFLIALTMGAAELGIDAFLPLKPILLLSVQILSGILLSVFMLQILKLDSYVEMKQIVREIWMNRTKHGAPT
jgi:teichuronic acid exporter